MMAENLDEFPFGWIATDLQEGNCIPFLGAGASSFPKDIESKPPSARMLAMELAKESTYPQYQVARDVANGNDEAARQRAMRAALDCENLMLVSSWVEHGRGDRPRLHRKLREYLANERRPLPSNRLHELLARVANERPMAIITTNYDDLAELALVERGVPFDLFVVAIDRSSPGMHVPGTTLFRPAGKRELRPVTAEEPILEVELEGGEVRLKRTAVFKMHGHIGRTVRNDDTFVITEEDYVSFLGRLGSGDSVIPADLVNLMQSRTLLFLGYALRDWNFRVLLDRLNRMRHQAIRSYAIAYDIDPAESRLWDQRNVSVFNADLNEFVPRLDAALAQTQLRST
jgi:hypothetical protein